MTKVRMHTRYVYTTSSFREHRFYITPFEEWRTGTNDLAVKLPSDLIKRYKEVKKEFDSLANEISNYISKAHNMREYGHE